MFSNLEYCRCLTKNVYSRKPQTKLTVTNWSRHIQCIPSLASPHSNLLTILVFFITLAKLTIQLISGSWKIWTHSMTTSWLCYKHPVMDLLEKSGKMVSLGCFQTTFLQLNIFNFWNQSNIKITIRIKVIIWGITPRHITRTLFPDFSKFRVDLLNEWIAFPLHE